MTSATFPADLIEQLRKYDSATVANAIEPFNRRDPVTGYASLELRCLFPKRPPMVGYAVTCTADTTRPGNTRPLRLIDLVEVVAAAPKPFVLVIQYEGEDRLRSCFVGDMFAAWLQRLGGVGVVTDGGVRDTIGMETRAPEMQVFAAGSVASHGSGSFLDFNIPTSICGLTIEAGVLLHGDDNGLVSIPLEVAASIPKQCEMIVEEEAAFFEFLQADEFSPQALREKLANHDKKMQASPQREAG
jgi:4-hydroxy-4-methyl-2-oxoglutarate aldolase